MVIINRNYLIIKNHFVCDTQRFIKFLEKHTETAAPQLHCQNKTQVIRIRARQTSPFTINRL